MNEKRRDEGTRTVNCNLMITETSSLPNPFENISVREHVALFLETTNRFIFRVACVRARGMDLSTFRNPLIGSRTLAARDIIIRGDVPLAVKIFDVLETDPRQENW